MRKCAGTSIAEVLNYASVRYTGRMIHSTEGKTIDTSSPGSSSILDQSGLMTVISLREPIDRIVSLYWYEHASFHYMRNSIDKIASLDTWFLAWSDGSAWKKAFVDKNPGNVYVEVENYYVKVLSGWQGGLINETTLDIAKVNLRKFDVVLIKEWMTSVIQVDAMAVAFPGARRMDLIQRVIGDQNLKMILSPYARDEDKVKEKIAAKNKYDKMLYEYALTLAAKRLALFSVIVKSARVNVTNSINLNTCQVAIRKRHIGFYQPAGHKGPCKTCKTR